MNKECKFLKFNYNNNCAIKNTDEKLALTADKSLYIKILYNYKQINYLKRPML